MTRSGREREEREQWPLEGGGGGGGGGGVLVERRGGGGGEGEGGGGEGEGGEREGVLPGEPLGPEEHQLLPLGVSHN